MKQNIPKEFILNTAKVCQFKHSTKSKTVYLTLLLTFIGIFNSLPYLNIEVYSSAKGIIMPTKNEIHLNVMNSGRTLYSSIKNNGKLIKEYSLLIFDNSGVNDRYY